MEKTAGGPLGYEISDCKQGATPPSRHPPRGKLFQEFGRSSRAEPEVNSPRPPPLLGPQGAGVRLRRPLAPAREGRPLPGMLCGTRGHRGEPTGPRIPRGASEGSGAPRWGRARPEGTVHSRRGRKEPGAPRRGRSFPKGSRCAPAAPLTPGRDRALPEGTRAPRWGRALPARTGNCRRGQKELGAPLRGRAFPEGTRRAPAAPRTAVRARVLSRSRGRRGAAARRRCRAGRPHPCRRSQGRTRCPCFPQKAGGGRAGRRAASADRCPG